MSVPGFGKDTESDVVAVHLHALVVVEEEEEAAQLCALLQQCGYTGTVCKGGQEAVAALENLALKRLSGDDMFDIVISELNLKDGSAEDLLKVIVCFADASGKTKE